ncbi:vascular endothelial growth factor receptor kdr-like [Planococcus citri]|uniref:vascular endothelial growth factor receptor kdr-like n=1 Tax=Planococcus citri TaxID=170843 RepID=UPI0031FA027C
MVFICEGFMIGLLFTFNKSSTFNRHKDSTAKQIINIEENLIYDQVDVLPYDEKWEFPRKGLKLGKILGSGAFGTVRKAEAIGLTNEIGRTVAAKMVKLSADPLHVKALTSELKIMIYLGHHVNVLNLLGACTTDLDKNDLVVIVEYCKYGNLHDFLFNQRNNFINQINESGEIDFTINNGSTNDRATNKANAVSKHGADVMEPDETCRNYQGEYNDTDIAPIKTKNLIDWCSQIAKGMEYTASRKVLHGDLAARNVLLADGFVIKICDFGLAKNMYEDDIYERTRATLLPIRWMAIESIKDRVFSTQSDVWSFGITMWELFSLSSTPYPGIQCSVDLYEKLVSGYRMGKPQFASDEIYGIMKECWNFSPMSRPTFTQLINRIEGMLKQDMEIFSE